CVPSIRWRVLDIDVEPGTERLGHLRHRLSAIAEQMEWHEARWPLVTGDIDPVLAAELDFVQVAAPQREHCAYPAGRFQSEVEAHDQPRELVDNEVEGRPADDVVRIEAGDDVYIDNGRVDFVSTSWAS